MQATSENNNINELRYRIGRLDLEISNLSKMIDKKKKNNVLNEDEEYEIQMDISSKKKEIQNLESEIRRIENSQVREQNFEGRGTGIEF